MRRIVAAAAAGLLLLLGAAALGAAQEDDPYEDDWESEDDGWEDWRRSYEENRSRQEGSYHGNSSYDRNGSAFAGDHVRFTLDEDLPGVRGYALVDGDVRVLDAVDLPPENDTRWMTHHETFALESGPHDLLIRDNTSYRVSVDVVQNDSDGEASTAVVHQARLHVADGVDVERNDTWSDGDDEASVYDLHLPDGRTLHLAGDRLDHRNGTFVTADHAVLGDDLLPERDERPDRGFPEHWVPEDSDAESEWDRDGDEMTGDHVAFAIDEDLPGIRDHRILDPEAPVFDAVRLPGDDEAEWRAQGRSLGMATDEARLVVGDVPPSVLTVRTFEGASATLTLAPGVTADRVTVPDDDAPEDAVLYELRLPGNQSAWVGGIGIRMVHAETSDGPRTSFLVDDVAHFRALEPGEEPGPDAGDDRDGETGGADGDRGPPQHALDRETRVQVERAAAAGKVGVEVHPDEDGSPDAVSNGHVEVREAYGAPDDEVKAGVTLEAPDGSEGTVLRMTLDGEALEGLDLTEATERLEVRFDDASIEAADDLEDALDWSDDDGEPEYLLLVGGEEVEVLVSIPHFSPHTVEIVEAAGGAEAQGTPGFGALAALASLGGAAAARARRW